MHLASRGSYGAPRVDAELQLGRGRRVGRKRAAGLMRAVGGPHDLPSPEPANGLLAEHCADPPSVPVAIETDMVALQAPGVTVYPINPAGSRRLSRARRLGASWI